MQFCNVESRHLDMLAGSYAGTFNAPPWFDCWTAETAFARLEEIYHTPKSLGLMALEKGALLAAALGSAETFCDGTQFCIREFWVGQGQRGKGVGRALMEQLEKELSALGVTLLYLSTSRDNGTCQFYEALGFEHWPDVTVMGKSL